MTGQMAINLKELLEWGTPRELAIMYAHFGGLRTVKHHIQEKLFQIYKLRQMRENGEVKTTTVKAKKQKLWCDGIWW